MGTNPDQRDGLTGFEGRLETVIDGEHQFTVTGPWWDHELNCGQTGWKVSLPHQCDDWEINGDGDPLDVAREKLSRFIAEAQAALDYLIAQDHQSAGSS